MSGAGTVHYHDCAYCQPGWSACRRKHWYRDGGSLTLVRENVTCERCKRSRAFREIPAGGPQ